MISPLGLLHMVHEPGPETKFYSSSSKSGYCTGGEPVVERSE